jgi:tRNA threonylcarbamoyladenosine biosynthesis protein TsaE
VKRAVTVIRTTSVEETERVGEQLATTLRPGSWIALDGALGSGKTQLVRGLVRGLGGDARRVHSPTFVLLNVYETPRGRVWHADAYRLGPGCDLAELGIPDPVEEGFVVVEWAGNAAEGVPSDAVEVRIEIRADDSRSIRVSASSGRVPGSAFLDQSEQKQEHNRADRRDDQ